MDSRRSSAHFAASDTFSANDTEDPPILYLRNGMLVRDSAHAATEMTPEGRAWSYTIFISIGAAILGSALGMLKH